MIITNGLLGVSVLVACALLSPDKPLPLVLCILVLAGLTRSMQFTAFSTLAFADLGREQQGAGATLGTMLQQVCTVLGVVLATAALTVSQGSRAATEPSLIDFQIAFLVTAVVGLVTCIELFRISPDAGPEVSGHRAIR